VIGVLISFQFLEVNLTSLAVIFGLLSVGIGFGLQNITANFISGLIIMFERPISVGDRVQVGDKE
jgi:small-conductance mechanosensitive channel